MNRPRLIARDWGLRARSEISGSVKDGGLSEPSLRNKTCHGRCVFMCHMCHCGQRSDKTNGKDLLKISFQGFIMAAWSHVLRSIDR